MDQRLAALKEQMGLPSGKRPTPALPTGKTADPAGEGEVQEGRLEED
jgi:hypothetical protein